MFSEGANAEGNRRFFGIVERVIGRKALKPDDLIAFHSSEGKIIRE
jgi:hypothetical protein